MGRDTTPCMVKIGKGGELRVPVDTKRWVEVYVTNMHNDETTVTILPFRGGKQVESIGVSPWHFKRKSENRNRKFNDPFFSGSGAFKVDELRVRVERGLIYATVSQWDKYRQDFYNPGNRQNGKSTSPDKNLTISITDDNPFGAETKGHFFLRFDTGGKSEKVNFVVQNKKTKTWQYPATRHINRVDVVIGMGEGRAKISLIHPESKNATLKEPARPVSKKIAGKTKVSNTTAIPKTKPIPGKPAVKVQPSPSSDVHVTAPESIIAGSAFQVTWKGPNKPSDYITIVPAGAKDSHYLSYAYTSKGSPSTLKAPVKSGKYEVRYILNNPKKVLARAFVEISQVKGMVKAPTVVKIGEKFKVSWKGPNYPNDYITIVPMGANEREYMSYAYTSNGTPAELQAPGKPGEYEVRYIIDQSRSAIARTPVTVK